MDLLTPPPPGEPPPQGFSGEERLWATFAHLAGALGWIVPLGNIIAPLVLWLWQKDKSAFVGDQAKEALNFQITVTLAVTASVMLMYVLIGFLLIAVVSLFALVMMVIAAVKANRGQYFRYPLTFRFVR
jgi:uncharacterized Tic20 family protein